MNKRQRKKFLRKGNCPRCMNDRKVQFLRCIGGLKGLIKDRWEVINCDCGYKKNLIKLEGIQNDNR